MNGLRIPLATYRLQFHQGFRFGDAQEIVSYLNQLGITDVYASPLLKARAGSLHCYDVTDHSELNPELGTEGDFESFSDTLQQHEMGLIMDVVPNHMEIDDPANRWWNDVLENGPGSSFADFFDIDWSPPKRGLRNRVLLPVLGDQFGKVLENGEIKLSFDGGAFFVNYYDHRFPLDPRTTTKLLATAADHVRFISDSDDQELIELESVLTALKHLPDRTETEGERLAERRREIQVAKRRLAKLTESSVAVRRAIEAVVAEWCGRHGEPDSFDRLEQLLVQQAYRMCHWRVAADEINYRRFFDINDLAAIRVEERRVFDAVHEVTLRLIGEGRVNGLRIDHPDGLYDPQSYFAALQDECRRALPTEASASSKTHFTSHDCALYVVAEKILSRNEQLPSTWAVHGTTGYDMLNLINGLLVDEQGQEPLQQWYGRLYPDYKGFDDLAYQCKKVTLNVSMSSELHVLARRLDRVSEQHRWSRDFTLLSLNDALCEVIACFPVYRTYVRKDSVDISDEERRQIRSAIRNAKARNPAIDASVFDFIESVLLLEEPERLTDAQHSERREFLMKLQQLTGPVTAKGIEDTAFYRVYPLASLNEVGGEPEEFAVSVEEFHRYNRVRCGRWPYSMVATSTHDTKRSEDVRAWINVLSEIPHKWRDMVLRWQQLNEGKKSSSDGRVVPDLNEEYLFYQTLVGMWPLEPLVDVDHLDFVERLTGYMEKALREAKLHTSWVRPDEEYEQAVTRFVRGVLSRDTENVFLMEVEQFRERININGMCNALTQVLLKTTVPGVPDFYQGCELWDFSLVDPDNRRAVDYELRRKYLDELIEHANSKLPSMIDNLISEWRDGRIKLYTTHAALQFRRQESELFLDGEYVPIATTGMRQGHVSSFMRRLEKKATLAVVPRLTVPLTVDGRLPLGEACWEDTALTLPDDAPVVWKDIFTNTTAKTQRLGTEATLRVSDILQRFPVALLEAIE